MLGMASSVVICVLFYGGDMAVTGRAARKMMATAQCTQA